MCMKIKHEKSPCCGGVVWRFGKRRRQCKTCKNTWSAWKKKRGRKQKRSVCDLAERFVLNRSLPLVAPRSGKVLTARQRQYALSKSRAKGAQGLPWPTIPENTQFIAVADGLVKLLGKQWHTWYLILLRPVNEDRAIILPQYHRLGTETHQGWREAFEKVPKAAKERIVALVCDGHVGLVGSAKVNNWFMQRCHFHLISRLQAQRSRWKKGRNRKEANALYEAVSVVLAEENETKLPNVLRRIGEQKNSTASREVKKVLRGFLANYGDYRTYINHPEFRLPTTNNTAETLVHIIETLSKRARGFRNAQTLDEWITILIKIRKKIYCRPKNQQN